MQHLIKNLQELQYVGRWDIDFHLPPTGILAFPESLLVRVDEVADVIKVSRDPTKKPEELFHYVDISSVDPSTGEITAYQELLGAEAPSRARKVVNAFDIIISTVRPTRGAIAVVPVAFHNKIVSTGFTIIRAKEGINPFYLHFALRLESTLEQFRKWSTGSSYPAILDEDVEKTLIPVPDSGKQDEIACKLLDASTERKNIVSTANNKWHEELTVIISGLKKADATTVEVAPSSASLLDEQVMDRTIAEIKNKLARLSSDR